MRENDPWSVLGLRPGATPEEIRKAFRRRIKKAHPDSREADSIHIQSVCSLVQAYRFLEKRFVPEVIGNTVEDDVQDSLLREAGDGLFLFIEVSVREAFRGSVVKVSVSDLEAACPACNGAGDVELPGMHECSHCSGTGFHELPWGKNRLRVVCNSCDGKGIISRRKCNLCKGTGKITRQRTIDVRLPRGVRDGSIIKLPGQGHWRQDRQSRDALFVEVHLSIPDQWRIEGLDVRSSVDVDLWTALAGGSIVVETVEGPESIRLDPCSFEKGDMVLEGRGWISVDGRRGDHVITINVVFPDGEPPPAGRALIGWLRQIWPAGKYKDPVALPPPGRGNE